MNLNFNQGNRIIARATIVAAIIGAIAIIIGAIITAKGCSTIPEEELHYFVIASSWEKSQKRKAFNHADFLASKGYKAEVFLTQNGYLAVTICSFCTNLDAKLAQRQGGIDADISGIPEIKSKGFKQLFYVGKPKTNRYYIAICSCGSYGKINHFIQHFNRKNPDCSINAFQSENGKYAITIDGPYTYDEGKRIQKRLIEQGKIPNDSFLIHESKLSPIK